MADEFVRIRTSNGMESTLSAAYVEGIEDAEGIEILDEPATNTWGRPLAATRRNGRPAKPRTTTKKAAAPAAGSSTPTTTGGAAADSPEEAKA